MSSTHDIANQIHSLAFYDRAVDFSPIKEAIEIVEAERTRRALKAITELEAAKSEHRGRRFVVAWQSHDGTLHTTRGIAYVEKGDDEAPQHLGDEQQERRGYGALVDDYRAPFPCRYCSMGEFREFLDEQKRPYAIVYLD